MSLAREVINLVREIREINESSLGRVYQHFNSGEPVAIISASRGELPPEEMNNLERNILHRKIDMDNEKDKRLYKEWLARFNTNNNKSLQQAIRSGGFGFVPVLGGYEETQSDGSVVSVTEKSNIVFSSPDREEELRELAIKLGGKFGQDSIFFLQTDRQSFWIYTRDFNGHNVGDTEPCGKFHPKQIGAYFTKVGKKNFSFSDE